MRRLNNLFVIALLVVPAVAVAKTSDAEQPIQIEADQVEIHERDGLSIYRGNVRIVQGTLHISGDEIRFRTLDQGVQKVHILGKPARFSQLTDQNYEISAQGEEMEYQAGAGLLTLTRNAVLVQQGNRFTSEHIIYNTKTSVVKAGAGDKASSTTPARVSITVMPEKTKPDTTPKETKTEQKQ